MEMLMAALVGFLVGVIVARSWVKNPTEEEMFDALVELRRQRKVKLEAYAEIQKELEEKQ